MFTKMILIYNIRILVVLINIDAHGQCLQLENCWIFIYLFIIWSAMLACNQLKRFLSCGHKHREQSIANLLLTWIFIIINEKWVSYGLICKLCNASLFTYIRTAIIGSMCVSVCLYIHIWGYVSNYVQDY